MASRPPFTAIFVFCAAARCGSFKLAAQELCVTPGAVSRQIQTLEEYLGHALFERGSGAVRLTRKGVHLRERVAEKMYSIGLEVNLMRSGARKSIIRVDVGVTVAMHWLIPRLAEFSDANPDIEVQILTSDGPIDLTKRMDLYVRREPSEFRGLHPERFLEEYSVLVASPKFVAREGVFSVRDMARRVRIGSKSRPDLWPQWSRHHAIVEGDYQPTVEFDNTVLAIQATVEGLGVIVVPKMFVTSMLECRLLVLLDSTSIPTGFYSYVAGTRRVSEASRTFTTWMRQAL